MAKIKKHTDKECDCVFCNCKCPECGSMEIWIRYGIRYECTNNIKDRIALLNTGNKIELQCYDCDAMLDLDDDERMNKEGEKLRPLMNAISRTLDLNTDIFFEYKDNHEIDVKQSYTVSRPIDKDKEPDEEGS